KPVQVVLVRQRTRVEAMRRGVWFGAVAVVVAVAGAQLIRPNRTNPAVDASRTFAAQMGPTSGVVDAVDRACRDCHSNETTWPWYRQVAPLSWVMARAVAEGRQVVNFSEWAAYSRDQQRMLLAASCHAASEGTMPGGAWTMLHPEARLAPGDIETICSAAR